MKQYYTLFYGSSLLFLSSAMSHFSAMIAPFFLLLYQGCKYKVHAFFSWPKNTTLLLHIVVWIWKKNRTQIFSLSGTKLCILCYKFFSSFLLLLLHASTLIWPEKNCKMVAYDNMKTKLNFFLYAMTLLLKFHDKIISPKKSPLSYPTDYILFIFYERLHEHTTFKTTYFESFIIFYPNRYSNWIEKKKIPSLKMCLLLTIKPSLGRRICNLYLCNSCETPPYIYYTFVYWKFCDTDNKKNTQPIVCHSYLDLSLFCGVKTWKNPFKPR